MDVKKMVHKCVFRDVFWGFAPLATHECAANSPRVFSQK